MLEGCDRVTWLVVVMVMERAAVAHLLPAAQSVVHGPAASASLLVKRNAESQAHPRLIETKISSLTRSAGELDAYISLPDPGSLGEQIRMNMGLFEAWRWHSPQGTKDKAFGVQGQDSTSDELISPTPPRLLVKRHWDLS